MKCRLLFIALALLLLTNIELLAQPGPSTSSKVAYTENPTDVSYWVAYWAKPRLVLFGSEEEAFNTNVHEIMFPWNNYDGPLNPNVLDGNVAWMKDHANDRFYIEGYASSDGELGYNLNLSRQRADWVKQTLINKGIPEDRIVLAAPWGQLLPACPELNEDCWSKNRVVRFVYSPK
jgi:outer membrane protein OmpA-like peptidoglycan-associated protein